MNIVSLHEQGIEASKKELKKFLEDWNKNTGGNKYGEPMYCGFAGVVIKPARGKFVSYLKSLDMGYKHYYGGWYVSVREFGQSLTRKEAYAEAFAKVLSEVGMRCYVDSRMD